MFSPWQVSCSHLAEGAVLQTLFFRSLQLIIFINALQPTVLAPLAENLYSQGVLLAGFTVPLAGNQQRRSSRVGK